MRRLTRVRCTRPEASIRIFRQWRPHLSDKRLEPPSYGPGKPCSGFRSLRRGIRHARPRGSVGARASHHFMWISATPKATLDEMEDQIRATKSLISDLETMIKQQRARE